MKWLVLIVALVVAGCKDDTYWEMDGRVLIVDDNSPLSRGPIMRCVEQASDYLCETVPQSDRDVAVVQRGNYVRVSAQRFSEFERLVYEASGTATSAEVRTSAQWSASERLVLSFADYSALYPNREFIWFMPREYLAWMMSNTTTDFPYPLGESALETSISQIVTERCGNSIPVTIEREPNGSFIGMAGPMRLTSNNGVYWRAEGECASINRDRAGERRVP